MAKLIDLTGRKFGCLVVVERAPGRNTRWLCRCELCGAERVVQAGNLYTGHTHSCMCKRRDPAAAEARFWEKVKKGDGCWEWTGARFPKGYGTLRFLGTYEYAHRQSWRLTYGEPGDLCVLHRCDNPPCVRPDHLFLGTHRDNAIDMVAKDRWGNQTRKRA